MNKFLNHQKRVFILLLFASFIISCQKISSDPVPQTATHFLTNGEDKRWFKIEDRYIESDISIPAEDCTLDDLDVFVVNNTIYREYGDNKCNVADAPLINGTWKFMDDERFIIRRYLQNDHVFDDTLQILLLNDHSLIVKRAGQDLIKSIYYTR